MELPSRWDQIIENRIVQAFLRCKYYPAEYATHVQLHELAQEALKPIRRENIKLERAKLAQVRELIHLHFVRDNVSLTASGRGHMDRLVELLELK